MLRYIATILVALAVHPALSQVCPYRECGCVATFIDCSNRGLTAVPTRVDAGSRYTSLSFVGNKITSINASSLLPTRLDTLDLSDNPISEIVSSALFGISQTLKSIKFRKSNFATLPPALEILDRLEILDIENDAMTFPDATVTKLSTSITSLRLSNVVLTSWPAWLGKFTFLRQLYLDGNTRLGNPPTGSLTTWSKTLTHLSLSNIGASSVSAVSGLEQLQWLDVSMNSISDFLAFSYDLIPTGSTLQYLDASRNSFATEPRLADLTALTEIHLSFNKISNVNIGAFAPSVINVYLDNNLFTAIPAFLSDMPQINVLSLQHNQIGSIGSSDFQANSRVSTLYLGENPISGIDERAFQIFRNSLIYLNLENTYLTRLPLALTVLAKLQTLWMPNNERLMCSCEEKSIAPWLTTFHNLRVTGQCGYIDITEFVAMLAAHCP